MLNYLLAPKFIETPVSGRQNTPPQTRLKGRKLQGKAKLCIMSFESCVVFTCCFVSLKSETTCGLWVFILPLVSKLRVGLLRKVLSFLAMEVAALQKESRGPTELHLISLLFDFQL